MQKCNGIGCCSVTRHIIQLTLFDTCFQKITAFPYEKMYIHVFNNKKPTSWWMSICCLAAL